MTDFVGGWNIGPVIEHIGLLLREDINELAFAPPLEFLACPIGNDGDNTSLDAMYLSLLAMKRLYGIGKQGTNVTFQSLASRLAATMLATGKMCYYSTSPDRLVADCQALSPDGTCTAAKVKRYAQFYVNITNLRRRMINKGPIKRPKHGLKRFAREEFKERPAFNNATE